MPNQRRHKPAPTRGYTSPKQRSGPARSDDQQAPGRGPHEPALTIQRTLGNRAFGQMVAEEGGELVQRLIAHDTFKKKTSLFARKGKSGAVFSTISSGLKDYQVRMANASPSAKLLKLEAILKTARNWLGSPGSNDSQRRKYVERLIPELQSEIKIVEGQLDQVDPTSFKDEHELDSQDGVLGGAMSKLDYVKYDVGIQETEDGARQVEGGEFEGYFKEDVDEDQYNDRHRGGEGMAGIPRNNPEFGKRNIAMYKLDQLLGAGVIPPTFAARHRNKQGIVMKKIEGIVGNKLSEDEQEMLEHPLVRQSLSRLYLLDVICAQVDRHSGNFIVEMEDGVIKGVKGIDNDLSFGKNYDIDMATDSKRFIPMMHMSLGKMPSELEEIDRDFAQRIIDLAANDGVLDDALDGLLSDAEITATKNRLSQLADFLRPLMGVQNGVMRTEWR